MAKKKVTIQLNEDLVADLKTMAAKNGTSMTDEIKQAISDRKFFLEKVKSGKEIILQDRLAPEGSPKVLLNYT